MQWADGCGGGVAPEATDSRLHTAFAFIGRVGRGSDRVGIIQPKADRFLIGQYREKKRRPSKKMRDALYSILHFGNLRIYILNPDYSTGCTKRTERPLDRSLLYCGDTLPEKMRT